MAKQFPLDIVITATDKASAALRRVQMRLQGMGEPVRRVGRLLGEFSERTGFNRVGREALALGQNVVALGTMAAVAAGGLATLALQTSQAADAWNDHADRLGMSVEPLQELTYAFKFFGVEAGQTIESLATLNKNLGDAKLGMGRAVPIFKGLGIDATKFSTASDLLPALADRLAKINDPAKRAAIATRLLGSSGAQMVALLGRGSGELERFRTEAHETGAVLDEEVIKNAGILNDVLDKLGLTFRGVAGNALGRMYPALTKIAEGLQKSLIKYQPQIEAFALSFAGDLPGKIERLGQGFNTLADALSPITTSLGWLFDTFGAGNVVITAFTAVIGGKLIAAVVALAANLAALGVSLSIGFWPITAIIAGVAAAVAAGWYLWKNWDDIGRAIGGTIDHIGRRFSAVWNDVKAAAKSALDWIIEKLTWIANNNPVTAAYRFGQRLGGQLFGGAVGPGAEPIGQSAMNNQPGPVQKVGVTVDFSNMPPGTRADVTAPRGMSIDLMRGYSMPGVR